MKLVLPRPSLVLAPVAGARHFGHVLMLMMCGITGLFAYWAVPKPPVIWRWIDVFGEGLVVAMLALWLVQLRASRPGGRVTTWLCLALSSLLLGGWADLMDEFWKFPREYTLLGGMESSFQLAGMIGLTWGLHLWRQEQIALNALRSGRERAYREHAQIDRLTQLGDGAYLLDQLRLQQRAAEPATLVMLGWADLAALSRQHGLLEADRLLQSTGSLLLLQLRPGDLLCRYAADRFVALLPRADRAMPDDLLASMSAHVHPCADGQTRARLQARMVQAPLEAGLDAESQLLRLVERLQ